MSISPEFTGLSAGLAVVGGITLGICVSLHLYLYGRVTGISGIFAGALNLSEDGFAYRFAFLSGLLITGVVCRFINLEWIFGPVHPVEASVAGMVLAGFLVGLGTQLGNGCTSGHGLCGLPRFSIRSFVNVCTFCASGILAASLIRMKSEYTTDSHVLANGLVSPFAQQSDTQTWVILTVGILLFLVSLRYASVKNEGATQSFVVFFLGVLFAVGLALAGMTDVHRVIGFLDFGHAWNPQLMLVLGSGVGLNLLAFYYITKSEKPVLADKFCLPTATEITVRLVLGGALFGVGWGLGGICPGPGLVSLGSGRLAFFWWTIAFWVGSYTYKVLEKLNLF